MYEMFFRLGAVILQLRQLCIAPMRLGVKVSW